MEGKRRGHQTTARRPDQTHEGILSGAPMVLDVRVQVLSFVLWLRNDVFLLVSELHNYPPFHVIKSFSFHFWFYSFFSELSFWLAGIDQNNCAARARHPFSYLARYKMFGEPLARDKGILFLLPQFVNAVGNAIIYV